MDEHLLNTCFIKTSLAHYDIRNVLYSIISSFGRALLCNVLIVTFRNLFIWHHELIVTSGSYHIASCVHPDVRNLLFIIMSPLWRQAPIHLYPVLICQVRSAPAVLRYRWLWWLPVGTLHMSCHGLDHRVRLPRQGYQELGKGLLDREKLPNCHDLSRDLAPFYWHGLTLIPAWTHMPSRVWDELTYPQPLKFGNGGKWFHPILYNWCNYLFIME